MCVPLCPCSEYWNRRDGLDFRSLRYPGVISHSTVPGPAVSQRCFIACRFLQLVIFTAGGGTTDYAVEIYYEALKKGKYTSFLSANSSLPMMYMPDCLKATRVRAFRTLLACLHAFFCRSCDLYNLTSMLLFSFVAP